jgi:PilZ domain
MTFENSGADYLRRLRHQESPELVREPDREPDASAPAAAPAPAPAPGERRRSPRYKCEGSAEFRVAGSAVRTWGTFTDISVTGCYVEMTATFPVGATVDLGLELHGVRVQVQGEVRVSYPYLGMGIAFTEISDQNRMRLRDLIDSLAPPSLTKTAEGAEAVPGSLALPLVVNPAAALQAVADFFEKRGLLTKEEFVQILRRSQGV